MAKQIHMYVLLFQKSYIYYNKIYISLIQKWYIYYFKIYNSLIPQ